MQGLLQPCQQTLLVRSPTEGSLQNYSRYEGKGKKRIVYKNNKGEIIEPHEKLAKSQYYSQSQAGHSVKSRTTTPTPSESLKTQTNSIFDILPIDDPIWLDLIPQEIQQDQNFNLERLIMDNQEYFINLLGLYCYVNKIILIYQFNHLGNHFSIFTYYSLQIQQIFKIFLRFIYPINYIIVNY